VWDKVFGTLTVPDQVQVPRRLAMRWLLDEDGEVKPQFREDYALRGGSRLDADAELADAFANRPPALDDDVVLDLTEEPVPVGG